MRLDVCNRGHGGEACHLEGDERLYLVRAERPLDTAEARPVVVAGMRPHLQAECPASPRGRDRDRRRARVDAARDVRAVDRSQHGLVLAGALTDIGVEVHLCCVWPWRRCIACSRSGSTAASDSVAPLLLPGTLRISARPRTPAIPRESADIGVLASPARRMSSAIPGTSSSITSDVACGVTSRGRTPVPP